MIARVLPVRLGCGTVCLSVSGTVTATLNSRETWRPRLLTPIGFSYYLGNWRRSYTVMHAHRNGCIVRYTRMYRPIYYIILYYIILYYIILYYIILYYIILYYIILYYIILYCIALHCIALYCTVLYCTVLYCTVLYCTILGLGVRQSCYGSCGASLQYDVLPLQGVIDCLPLHMAVRLSGVDSSR